MPESSDVHVAIGGDRGVQATAGRFRRGIRIFASPVTQPRFRRATDILMLVPALLGTAFLIVAYPPSAFERSLATFLASVPAWLDPMWGFLYDLLGLWAIALVIASVAARRRTVVHRGGREHSWWRCSVRSPRHGSQSAAGPSFGSVLPGRLRLACVPRGARRRGRGGHPHRRAESHPPAADGRSLGRRARRARRAAHRHGDTERDRRRLPRRDRRRGGCAARPRHVGRQAGTRLGRGCASRARRHGGRPCGRGPADRRRLHACRARTRAAGRSWSRCTDATRTTRR